MICRGGTIGAAALLLAACADDAPPAPAETEQARNEPLAEAEVAGEERRILAFGDSLFAGYGLAEDEGYAVLVPFFMEPLLGRPEWVQPDRIHPTAEGIDAMVAATVDAVAEALPKD